LQGKPRHFYPEKSTVDKITKKNEPEETYGELEGFDETDGLID
jgi:hypothetical protein